MQIALVAMTAAFCFGAEAPKESTDRDLIQGVWVMTSLETEEVRLSGATVERYKTAFVGQEYLESSDPSVAGTFALNPTKKPKWIDIRPSYGSKKGETICAIYELDGNTLRVCYSTTSSQERPQEMPAKPGNAQALAVYKRYKP